MVGVRARVRAVVRSRAALVAGVAVSVAEDFPLAIVQTRDGTRQVRARRAQGRERQRLWSRWAEIDKNLDDYAARRPTETAVVVLEPRDAAEHGS